MCLIVSLWTNITLFSKESDDVYLNQFPPLDTHTHILCFLLRRVLAILHLLIFCMNLRIIFSSSEKYLVRIFVVIILNWLDWSGGKIGVTTKLHFPINKYVSISIYLGILLCSSMKFYNFIDKNLAHHLLYLFLLLYILEFPLKKIFF